jgi:hypothetical protein
VKGQDYAFLGKSIVTVVDVTKNRGTARARRTHTDFDLVHDGKRRLLTDRFVPALGPGESHKARSSSDQPITAPLGAYRLEVCVDTKHQVRESNEKNNCEFLPRPSEFYVIAQTWFGSLSGIKTLADEAIETWRSTDASFDVELRHGRGLFSYLFSGTVKWSDSGSYGGGCVQSGTGTRTYSDDDSLGELVVDYGNETYTSTDLTELGGPFYTIDITCPHGHSTFNGPYQPQFWNPSPDGAAVPMPFGSRELSGSPSHMANVTWVWDLKAGFRR